jgi:hypothetical protein
VSGAAASGVFSAVTGSPPNVDVSSLLSVHHEGSRRIFPSAKLESKRTPYGRSLQNTPPRMLGE